MLSKLLKPLLDDEYNRGFSAGVNAEKLVKEKENERREYDLLRRGIAIGVEETLRKMEDDIEEISAEEFDTIANSTKPFGFVGTIENMSLSLDD